MALIVTILVLSARSRVTLVKGISGRSLNQSRISAGDALRVSPADGVALTRWLWNMPVSSAAPAARSESRVVNVMRER